MRSVIQVDGGDLVGEVSYKFSLTDLGRKRAQDAHGTVRLHRSRAGSARGLRRAVLPADRHRACTATPRRCKAPFAHLVLKEEMFNNVGPAIISGRSACSSTALLVTGRPRWPERSATS